MNWKPKNETCGVPGKGFIKAEDYSQKDEDALIARAKNRKIDVNLFMLGAGFIPANGPQLEITEAVEEEPLRRKRRTKEEIEADKAKE
jgi:hypothetical protein